MTPKKKTFIEMNGFEDPNPFGSPRTIPFGWDVSAFPGSAEENGQGTGSTASPTDTQHTSSGEYDYPQNTL